MAYIIFVFVQSLFFKFTDSPETDYIFLTKLNPWALELTGYNLFARNGIFSAYVIGSAELVASILMALSLIPQLKIIRVLASLLSMAIMTGAISFHLFTPLGVEVVNESGMGDMGLLFQLAVGVWLSALLLIILNFADFCGIYHLIQKKLGKQQ